MESLIEFVRSWLQENDDNATIPAAAPVDTHDPLSPSSLSSPPSWGSLRRAYEQTAQRSLESIVAIENAEDQNMIRQIIEEELGSILARTQEWSLLVEKEARAAAQRIQDGTPSATMLVDPPAVAMAT